MINILFIGKNIKYYKKLINELAIRNQNFRLCSFTNSIKEIIHILNSIELDFVLINLPLTDLQKLLQKREIKKLLNKIILLTDKDFYNFNNSINHIIKKTNILDDVISINSILRSHYKINSFRKNRISERLIKEKISNELSILGYNIKHLGSKYLIEVIYILYSAKDYYDNNLERDIYPIVAKKYGKSVNNIKCNIRNSTDNMYYSNKEEVIKKYLDAYYINSPQPKKVIFAILEKLKYNNIV